ncbi:formimidoylglutamase [Acinetobacter bouvetii DSM 14964 = CIP 107468]|uniref:Formimidoylglutamase n=1 Tax=Acinetobacter bouvetii DSM 14964 = CIP 107468 TaxID=1120925 RepID=N9C918_9GAMM|nr:formimidoylglutamase [Acinetobacter bouvetii]ENV82352.1 formimidoylglutamase [Acinetobacter bouvetii DSM 14964 = CIP 107468]BCU64247.1 formimidoylglutamase [Acinetobacter bouvetii]
MDQSFQWQGRHDGDGAEHMRIFHLVNQSDSADFAILGFSSDEGVRRNRGRTGAANAPNLIRQQLANLPIHVPIRIQDMGTVVCVDSGLEKAQAELADQVELALQQGMQPIVLGGGHEIAFGSFSGIFQYVQNTQPGQKIGIINFDAHFDLREAEQATSGTPFLQAAKLSEQHGKAFHYLCIGVAKHSNTQKLFQTADRLGCHYIFDDEIEMGHLAVLKNKLDHFIDAVDVLYVTVDLDVFAASIAPGVSAPAVKGIDLRIFEHLMKHIHDSGKIKLLDIAECNPHFDQDNITARLAAFIAYQYMFYPKNNQ